MHRKSIAEKDSSPRIVCTAPWRLKKVTPLSNYKLNVEFIDGTHGSVEMSHRILSDKSGVFGKLKDIKLFNQVYLEYGVVTWPGEIDLAPDAMYDEIKNHGEWILK
jgi:uncharacterized protein DUF2442